MELIEFVIGSKPICFPLSRGITAIVNIYNDESLLLILHDIAPINLSLRYAILNVLLTSKPFPNV